MNNGLKVLIVDDEKNMRGTLARILAAAGHAVGVAESGEQAVDLCRADAFDAVLMDTRMTGMNGVDAFRQIRQSLPDCRVILMSAYPAEGLRKAALEEGAIAFLRKPLDIPRMLGLVRGDNHG